jgi:hypothetical protein
MSAINGDKSRFHRQRKQRIQRRMRDRVMYAKFNLGQPGSVQKSPAATTAGKRNDAAHE